MKKGEKKLMGYVLIFLISVIFFALFFSGCDKLLSPNQHNNDTAETTTVEN
jgi:PBP1b-binding outer membrane lipoprotein LpoB|nr:MAG TPA: protein of unknown function (DUF5016) [Caudoviricetes sp.]